MNVLKKFNIETIEKAEKICPIYLHSFDYGTVKYWADKTELPVNYLVTKAMKFDLADVNKYATGMGFQDTIIYDYTTHQMTEVMTQSRKLGLMVHIWTFKDDALLFDSRNNLVQFLLISGHV